MNRLTQIKLILLTLLVSIILAGCGGGSDASFENPILVDSVATCNSTNTSWTIVNSGDVVSATASTQLKFDHDSSNNKQVCVVTGSATIL